MNFAVTDPDLVFPGLSILEFGVIKARINCLLLLDCGVGVAGGGVDALCITETALSESALDVAGKSPSIPF